MRIKIKNQDTINHIKLMHESGIKPITIAGVYKISSATYSNIKKTGWDFVAYKKLINGQMKSWKIKNQKAQLIKDRATSTLPPEIDKIVKESNGSSQWPLNTTVGSVTKLIEQISELTKSISKLNSFYGSKK